MLIDLASATYVEILRLAIKLDHAGHHGEALELNIIARRTYEEPWSDDQTRRLRRLRDDAFRSLVLVPRP